jgi:peptidoglycan lytic transglycosylase
VRFLLLAALVASASPAASQELRLPAPLYPDVVALVTAGRFDAALSALDAQLKQDTTMPDTPLEALMLRARLLSRNGKFLDSAEAWQAVADRESLAASFAKAESVRALLDAGDLETVLTRIAAAGTACCAMMDSTMPVDILVRAGSAARAAGMLDRATALYRQARASAGRTPAADQAALGLEATLEQAGNPREALQTLRELQRTFRQVSAYDAADAAARRLSAGPDDPEPLSESDYETISERLTNLAAFRRSVNVLTEWRTKFPDSAHRDDIDIAIIQNLYSLRANADARAYAEEFVKTHESTPKGASAFRTILSLDVREGNAEEVERRGFAILRGEVRGATLELRRGAGRQLAEFLLGVGNPAKAFQAFEELLVITRARGERIDLQWRMAVASIRAGNRARAIKYLTELRRLKLDSETDRATAFWLAYAHDESGSHAEARELWQHLINRYPYSYYGVKATAKGVKATATELAFPDLKLSDAMSSHVDYRTASLLSRAGLLSEASSFTRRLSSTFARDPGAALLAARAAEAAGDASTSSTLMTAYFGPYFERPSSGLPDDFWTLAYPRAYWKEVSSAAARHHVDPLMMLALARQESHFDRTIKSPVGAIGLFQIMPATAEELDPSFQQRNADEELVKPDIAAELAATLLEKNLTRFGNAAAPTIASYNADKERVQVWWDAVKSLPEELFVDSIPYRETRGYVRQVLANYAMYQRFAAPPPPQQK